MARTSRRHNTGVSARTAKRRAKRVAAAAEQRRQLREGRKREPETLTQAKVYDRKVRRYRNAGLCETCAAQAAWGHAIGFQKIHDPCKRCAPIVALFDTPGPRGSKWRKCLIRLETLDPVDVAAYLAELKEALA